MLLGGQISHELNTQITKDAGEGEHVKAGSKCRTCGGKHITRGDRLLGTGHTKPGHRGMARSSERKITVRLTRNSGY